MLEQYAMLFDVEIFLKLIKIANRRIYEQLLIDINEDGS